ncbi:hypothetical protein [Streptomyces sp. NBC_01373]|uniref:hypothetical protein n=1 Tax=unclassified Streptomyces TaxID=2593676 RepID=UPI002256A40B|nr:hypothetical protein [Streptomyces sp. NBC_01373]MCX4706185.1 hypothetical protein [Streptomyces sp. NBC_01373]
MSQLALSGVALAGAAGVYVVLAVLRFVRDRADRAAAAELLLAGLIQVDEAGRLSAHHSLRDAFLRAEDAKVPRWSARAKDALHTWAVLTAVLLALWFAVQLAFIRDFAASDGGNASSPSSGASWRG